MIPPIVKKLIPRLASPFNGEVISTVHLVIRGLEADGLDLFDLGAMADAAPAYRGRNLMESEYAKRVRARLKEILANGWLDTWSTEFVASVLERPNLDLLSEKQVAVVNKILRRAQMRKPESCPA